MASFAPPSILPTSALALGAEAFVAVRAAVRLGIADARATFEYSIAPLGVEVGFLVFAGLEPLLDALERFRMKTDELAWLESVGLVDDATRRRLADARFQCDVDAAPEGTIVFPGEPILSVEGPYWQAQLVGALVKSALGEATLAATKIARCVVAARDAEVLEVGSADARRLGGAPLMARAAFIAGASATTNALAGRRYGIPVRGIEPAGFAAAASDEVLALDAWLSAADGAIVRLSGRDRRASIATLVEVAKTRARRPSWDETAFCVELPADDAVELAAEIRAAFDDEGVRAPALLVSGALDAVKIVELRDQDVAFDGFAVSAHVAHDAASASRYALVAIEENGSWAPRLDVGATESFTTDPGRKVLIRYVDGEQHPVADVAHLTNERHLRAKDGRFVDRTTGFPTALRGAAASAPLLANVMRAGKRVNAPEPPRALRHRAQHAIGLLGAKHKRLANPAPYAVGTTSALAALKAELVARGSAK